MERRLAAILIADVAGYSRLSHVDEVGTRARFQADMDALFTPAMAEHHGRLVKTMGDGVLVEFHSVVDALQCAVAIQRSKSAQKPADVSISLDFRIGINLGDIIVEGDDIHGDGVNIADRIQKLAQPGGIAISGTAYDQVKAKIDVGFTSLGRQRVRSIKEPIRVYRVDFNPADARRWSRILGYTRRKVAMIAVLIVFAAAGASWWYAHDLVGAAPEIIRRFAYPLPEKPSVAVLPFINVSGDSDQDHLAEGITDDLITELSKVSGLFVIARHSVFALSSNVGKIQDVAAELGVHYILEGTLQRAGQRLRINAKLIDALTGLSMWAERYDRQYADLFAIQDEVTGKIISALEVELSEGERAELNRIPSDNLEAYDYYMRAEHEGLLYGDVDTYRRTLSYYQKAIELDPNFADAHAGIARVAVDVWRNDYNFLWSAAIARKIAYDAAGQALKLDPKNARAHTVLALLQLVDGRQAEALESAARAVESQPNSAEAAGNLALVLVQTGSGENAITEINRALRLDPSPSASFQLLAGIVLYIARDYARAIPFIEIARDALPLSEPAREYLSAAYGLEGNRSGSIAEKEKLLALFPESNLSYYSYLYDYWDKDDLQRHLAALKAAGIPDWPFGFSGAVDDRLNENEIRHLIDGRTWNGMHKNGTAFRQFFDKAGNTAYRSANTNITGAVEVRGNELCERFSGYFLDRLVCGHIYRNRKGGQSSAPYVHVTPQALKFFSLLP
jgi:adenylate cyclase